MRLTRRDALLAAGWAALAGCGAERGPRVPALSSRAFPAGFLWGAATSAFQIEGALDADGRGKSVWDVFPRSAVHDGSDASVGADSYRRYAEDVALIAGAGLDAYRFSIAWPRIFPQGAGALNEAGLDYYRRLVDALLEAGVAPYATLFHWDLPLALQEKGGWANRDTALRFSDYAEAVGARLGDRLKNFVILNEAAVHAVLGHVLGIHAPHLADANLLGSAIHHQNLAQGLALARLREARSDLQLGTTMALAPSRAGGGLARLLNGFAADGFDAIWNGAFLDPLLKASYPREAASLVAPHLRDGDLQSIRQPIDFLGVNYYAPFYMKFDPSSPSRVAAAGPPSGVERDAFDRHVDPGGLREILMRVSKEHPMLPLIVTENGCSDPLGDGPAEIDDQFRIDFLRRHLEAVLSAIEGGADVRGYFHWTLVDNWEWAEGYRSKFGLIAQDRASGVRTQKASYAWYSALAFSNLLDEAR